MAGRTGLLGSALVVHQIVDFLRLAHGREVAAVGEFESFSVAANGLTRRSI